jgi:hypothetical protein
MKSGKWGLVAVLLMVLAFPGEQVAGREKSDEVERITVDELILMLAKKKPVTIIDVRETDSYQEKIVGSLQIPHDQIKSRLKEIPRTREIVTYCA